MKNLNMKELKSFFMSFSEYQMLVQRLFLFLEIFVFLLGLVFKKNFGIVSLVIGTAACIYGIFTFCLTDSGRALKQFKIMCLTGALAVAEFLNGYFFTAFKKPPFMLLILIDLSLIVVTIVLINPNDSEQQAARKQMIEEFVKRNIYSSDNMEEKDTYMGYNIETGKPNVIPYKDRFLHALVLGVTGCGKTSQSLLPMVAKDIKCPDLGVVCLDPKGDFAEQVYAMAKLEGRDDVVYFNPTLSNCPYFNPMVGDEDSVSECLVTTFKKLENEQQTFFANMDEMLMRRCIKVAKRLKGDNATLNDVNILMNNAAGEGKVMLKNLSHLNSPDIMIEQENNEIISWFLTDYYTGLGGGRVATKTYEQCSGVRNQVSKLLANSLVKRLLCPQFAKEDMAYDEYLDFDRVLEKGGVLAMSSAQGELRELGSFIGYFLILSFESAVFRRPGDENTRKGVIFYVDEFQKYANDGYNDLLTQGRSYRVASVLATQTRAGIAANSSATEGKVLVDVVSSNCRNKIVYPGCSYEDAQYYSKEFGEIKQYKEKTSYHRSRGLFKSIDLSSQSEQISTEEKLEPIFYPTDIMQRPFGEAVSQVVKNNSVQKPCVVKLKFIDQSLKKKVDQFIENNVRTMHVNYNWDDEEESSDNKKRVLNSVENYEIEDLPSVGGDYPEEFNFGGDSEN